MGYMRANCEMESTEEIREICLLILHYHHHVYVPGGLQKEIAELTAIASAERDATMTATKKEESSKKPEPQKSVMASLFGWVSSPKAKEEEPMDKVEESVTKSNAASVGTGAAVVMMQDDEAAAGAPGQKNNLRFSGEFAETADFLESKGVSLEKFGTDAVRWAIGNEFDDIDITVDEVRSGSVLIAHSLNAEPDVADSVVAAIRGKVGQKFTEPYSGNEEMSWALEGVEPALAMSDAEIEEPADVATDVPDDEQKEEKPSVMSSLFGWNSSPKPKDPEHMHQVTTSNLPEQSATKSSGIGTNAHPGLEAAAGTGAAAVVMDEIEESKQSVLEESKSRTTKGSAVAVGAVGGGMATTAAILAVSGGGPSGQSSSGGSAVGTVASGTASAVGTVAAVGAMVAVGTVAAVGGAIVGAGSAIASRGDKEESRSVQPVVAVAAVGNNEEAVEESRNDQPMEESVAGSVSGGAALAAAGGAAAVVSIDDDQQREQSMTQQSMTQQSMTQQSAAASSAVQSPSLVDTLFGWATSPKAKVEDEPAAEPEEEPESTAIDAAVVAGGVAAASSSADEPVAASGEKQNLRFSGDLEESTQFLETNGVTLEKFGTDAIRWAMGDEFADVQVTVDEVTSGSVVISHTIDADAETLEKAKQEMKNKVGSSFVEPYTGNEEMSWSLEGCEPAVATDEANAAAVPPAILVDDDPERSTTKQTEEKPSVMASLFGWNSSPKPKDPEHMHQVTASDLPVQSQSSSESSGLGANAHPGVEATAGTGAAVVVMDEIEESKQEVLEESKDRTSGGASVAVAGGAVGGGMATTAAILAVSGGGMSGQSSSGGSAVGTVASGAASAVGTVATVGAVVAVGAVAAVGGAIVGAGSAIASRSNREESRSAQPVVAVAAVGTAAAVATADDDEQQREQSLTQQSATQQSADPSAAQSPSLVDTLFGWATSPKAKVEDEPAAEPEKEPESTALDAAAVAGGLAAAGSSADQPAAASGEKQNLRFSGDLAESTQFLNSNGVTLEKFGTDAVRWAMGDEFANVQVTVDEVSSGSVVISHTLDADAEILERAKQEMKNKVGSSFVEPYTCNDEMSWSFEGFEPVVADNTEESAAAAVVGASAVDKSEKFEATEVIEDDSYASGAIATLMMGARNHRMTDITAITAPPDQVDNVNEDTLDPQDVEDSVTGVSGVGAMGAVGTAAAIAAMDDDEKREESLTKQSMSQKASTAQSPSLMASLFGWSSDTKPKEEAIEESPESATMATPEPASMQLDAAATGMAITVTDTDKDIYSVTLEERPFGLFLTKTYNDQLNLFVTRCNPDSVADKAGVKPDYVLIAIEGESCEDMGAADVNRKFGEAARNILPLTITLRKGKEEEVTPPDMLGMEVSVTATATNMGGAADPVGQSSGDDTDDERNKDHHHLGVGQRFQHEDWDVSAEIDFDVVIPADVAAELEAEQDEQEDDYQIAVSAPDANGDNDDSSDKGIYSVSLTSRPFGIYLAKTYSDGLNLHVTRNHPGSEAERQGVIPGSVLIAIEGISCEDLGSVEVDKRFGTAARNAELPLTVTFRKGKDEEVKVIKPVPTKPDVTADIAAATAVAVDGDDAVDVVNDDVEQRDESMTKSLTKQSESEIVNKEARSPSLVDSLFGWATAAKEEEPDNMALDADDVDSTGIYSVTLKSRPFGLYLTKTYSDGLNLFCTRTNPDSEAEKAGVKPNSVLIAIEGESCEGIGSEEVNRRFVAAAKSTLPLTITFREGLEEEIKPKKMIKVTTAGMDEAVDNEAVDNEDGGDGAEPATFLSLPIKHDDRDVSAEIDFDVVIPADVAAELDVAEESKQEVLEESKDRTTKGTTVAVAGGAVGGGMATTAAILAVSGGGMSGSGGGMSSGSGGSAVGTVASGAASAVGTVATVGAVVAVGAVAAVGGAIVGAGSAIASRSGKEESRSAQQPLVVAAAQPAEESVAGSTSRSAVVTAAAVGTAAAVASIDGDDQQREQSLTKQSVSQQSAKPSPSAAGSTSFVDTLFGWATSPKPKEEPVAEPQVAAAPAVSGTKSNLRFGGEFNETREFLESQGVTLETFGTDAVRWAMGDEFADVQVTVDEVSSGSVVIAHTLDADADTVEKARQEMNNKAGSKFVEPYTGTEAMSWALEGCEAAPVDDATGTVAVASAMAGDDEYPTDMEDHPVTSDEDEPIGDDQGGAYTSFGVAGGSDDDRTDAAPVPDRQPSVSDRVHGFLNKTESSLQNVLNIASGAGIAAATVSPDEPSRTAQDEELDPDDQEQANNANTGTVLIASSDRRDTEDAAITGTTLIKPSDRRDTEDGIDVNSGTVLIAPSDRRDNTLDDNAVIEEKVGTEADAATTAAAAGTALIAYDDEEEEEEEPEPDPFDPTMGGLINWVKMADWTTNLNPTIRDKLWEGIFKEKEEEKVEEKKEPEEIMEEKLDVDSVSMRNGITSGTVLVKPARDVIEEEPAGQAVEEKVEEEAPAEEPEEEPDTPEVARIRKLLKVLTQLRLTGVYKKTKQAVPQHVKDNLMKAMKRPAQFIDTFLKQDPEEMQLKLTLIHKMLQLRLQKIADKRPQTPRSKQKKYRKQTETLLMGFEDVKQAPFQSELNKQDFLRPAYMQYLIYAFCYEVESLIHILLCSTLFHQNDKYFIETYPFILSF